ncbi:YbhB/YbcL family Raf kinase inhibitor-like protein [Candidatus Peregrinibacteria bacterium]|nr:YbhB/YbcL family Raf kinase inhibitor-like protein [Candidatus Peregrinibacteria bacterium]
MQITSTAFRNNQKIPSKHTCDAENLSPELAFSGVPENAQSLVLICHDPDAPGRGGWTHWMIINMDPKARGIGEGERPNSGLELNTDFGKPGYGGPCPPNGSHRYYFHLYALDAPLDLQVTAAKTDVEMAMEGHVIEKAELMGTYERK